MFFNFTKNKNGFSLVEILVVLLIISLLALIAVPTYLNQKNKAKNADATSSLKNSLTTISSLKNNEENWAVISGGADPSNNLAQALQDDQESIPYVTSSAGVDTLQPNLVYVYLSNDGEDIVLTVFNGTSGYKCIKLENGSRTPEWGVSPDNPPSITDLETCST